MIKRPGATVKAAGSWLLRLALSGIFIYAGLAKIRDPHAFAESIDSFRLLPAALVNASALTLPPLEILSGILALLSGRVRRVGAFSQLAMLAVFLTVLAQAQLRGLHVDCGCFGPDRFDVLSSSKNLAVAIVRDLILGAAAWLQYAAARETPLSP